MPGCARPTAIGPWPNSPPYSHALERLVDNLEAGGVDVTLLRTVRLKALSRMNTETRYPSDSEAPADRFDAEDSAQARTAASQVMDFAKAAISQ